MTPCLSERFIVHLASVPHHTPTCMATVVTIYLHIALSQEKLFLIYAGDVTARSSQAGVHVPEEEPDVLGDGARGMAPEAPGQAAAADHAGGKRGGQQGPLAPRSCAAAAAVRRHAEEEERRRDEEEGERQHRRRRQHSGETENEAATRQGDNQWHAAGKEGEERY